MKKRVLSFLLALGLVVGLAATPAMAATDEASKAADSLFELGLFKGTGTDEAGKPIYDLDKAPTRTEALVMLVRLLGVEAGVARMDWDMPFTDVADWAKDYVGYAVYAELTKGTSEKTFGSNDAVSASAYLTFVLRALGYDSSVDFAWDSAWTLSDKIGLTKGEYNAETKTFTRGDAVLISAAALNTKMKGSEKTLKVMLEEKGVFSDKVMLEVTCQALATGKATLSMNPTLSSKNSYAALTVDKVTVNGVAATVTVCTAEELAALKIESGAYLTNVCISFDEKAVVAAAKDFETSKDADGKEVKTPVMKFSIEATGTLNDMKTEKVTIEFKSVPAAPVVEEKPAEKPAA